MIEVEKAVKLMEKLSSLNIILLLIVSFSAGCFITSTYTYSEDRKKIKSINNMVYHTQLKIDSIRIKLKELK